MNNSELLKFADDYLANNAAESGSDELIRQLSSALRTLASQEKQEPVAWGRVIGGKAMTISRERTPANDTPLYTAPPIPPPAAGWDEAIEAALSAPHTSDCDKKKDRNIGPVQGWAVNVHVNGIQILNIESECLSGIPNIDDYADTVRNCAKHLLSFIGDEIAESASDCDKQECMGDASPCDPKDLQELLAKPSVLEPSDRTADVTVEELAERIYNAMPQQGMKMPWRQITTINGHFYQTIVDRYRNAARALLDAFTVGRR